MLHKRLTSIKGVSRLQKLLFRGFSDTQSLIKETKNNISQKELDFFR